MAVTNLKRVILKDNWPGNPRDDLGIPEDGFDATKWNDITNPGYTVGTKIAAFQTDATDGANGGYTMIYLRFYCLSDSLTIEDVSDGRAVVQQFCNSTCISSDGTWCAYGCTNDTLIDTGFKCGTVSGVAAIACSSMSDHDITTDGNNPGAYGWFWCGGVCPYVDMTTFNCDITTGGSVAAGKVINLVKDLTTGLSFDGADASANVCGISLVTDA